MGSGQYNLLLPSFLCSPCGGLGMFTDSPLGNRNLRFMSQLNWIHVFYVHAEGRPLPLSLSLSWSLPFQTFFHPRFWILIRPLSLSHSTPHIDGNSPLRTLGSVLLFSTLCLYPKALTPGVKGLAPSRQKEGSDPTPSIDSVWSCQNSFDPRSVLPSERLPILLCPSAGHTALMNLSPGQPMHALLHLPNSFIIAAKTAWNLYFPFPVVTFSFS